MLQELRVENLALIDRLQLEFSGTGTGLVVFTGETGAGKSIILQAVSLLLGGRAQSSWIRSECEQATIEALFELRRDNAHLHALRQQQALAEDDLCIIRRVLAQSGRSRFYLNDRMVTMRLVEDFAENLVNIAAQHDPQQLLSARRHVDFLDSFGELWDLRTAYEKVYNRWRASLARLQELRERERGKEQRRDFLAFQLSEIRAAQLTCGEEEELRKQRDKVKASAELASLAAKSHLLVRDRLTGPLTELRKSIERVAALDGEARALAERIRSVGYEVEDIELTLRNYRDSIPMDPALLEGLNERLALIRQLQRKYGVSVAEVLAYADKVEEELAGLDSVEQVVAQVSLEVERLQAEMRSRATLLSEQRHRAAAQLTSAMQAELASLTLAGACFEVAIVPAVTADRQGVLATGSDQVEFLFSANPGEPPKPLAHIASGGELSRLMLAMKCLLARRDQVATVIFDEIDSGISGKAVEAVAQKLEELSRHHQVLCVTHLPQIAAHAAEHFLVAKKSEAGRTKTTISSLNNEQRVMEIARMLGGEALTEQTVAYARELVERSKR